MQTIIDGEVVEVVLVYKNNKNIYLRFKEDKKLYATCNRFVKWKDIEKLIEENRDKITKMYREVCKTKEQDLFFNYLGKQYTICYNESVRTPYFDGDVFFVKDEKSLQKFYKKEVERIFTNEVERIVPYFKNIPKFTLRFRNMKTRWGVNNRGSNTITLNTELLKKELDLLDYVIIHELCHFYEPNHSPRFWAHVEKYYPKYKEARKRLRS